LTKGKSFALCSKDETTMPEPQTQEFIGYMLFWVPNQQCQGTKCNKILTTKNLKRNTKNLEHDVMKKNSETSSISQYHTNNQSIMSES